MKCDTNILKMHMCANIKKITRKKLTQRVYRVLEVKCVHNAQAARVRIPPIMHSFAIFLTLKSNWRIKQNTIQSQEYVMKGSKVRKRSVTYLKEGRKMKEDNLT